GLDLQRELSDLVFERTRFPKSFRSALSTHLRIHCRRRAARGREGDLQRLPIRKDFQTSAMTAAKPNFLIAGAGKAGTTSLHDYLGQHPDIFMSSFKEPNYFVPDYGYNDWEKYLSLFRGARSEEAIGESSTGYLYCKESPAWIKS